MIELHSKSFKIHPLYFGDVLNDRPNEILPLTLLNSESGRQVP